MATNLPLRAALSTALVVLAGAVYFTAVVPEGFRALVSPGILLVSMLVQPRAKRDDAGPRPARIIWDERDAGQKLSIVMFHALILGFAAFLAWQAGTAAYGEAGAWWQIPLAVLFMAAVLWLTQRNWSNRNAR